MSDQILSPKMLGYFTDAQRHELPDESGILCVFRAAPDEESGEMDVQELLFVDEHRSVRHCLVHHADHERWQAFLNPGEALWYSVGLAGYVNRERLAAAMIHAHKPRLNRDYLDGFPFDETTVHLYGKTRRLMSHFTVERRD